MSDHIHQSINKLNHCVHCGKPMDSQAPSSFAAGFGGWVDAKKSLPKEDGHYIVHAPSADPDKPLVAMAWYNPELGWSLLQECWCKAITHWMQKPKPPNDPSSATAEVKP